jgi:putative transcriptional regulator
MGRYTLDPNKLPELSAAEQTRLDAKTDGQLTADAAADADNPPLSDDELARMEAARIVRQVRARTGLSQTRFADAYRINVGRLRDLEQGRTQPDSALLAYLAVIDREPEAVERALGQASSSAVKSRAVSQG